MGAAQIKGCWLPLPLSLLEVGRVTVAKSMQQQSQIPLYHLCWYAAWSRVISLDEMFFLWLEIASEVHCRGQLRHQAAGSSAC